MASVNYRISNFDGIAFVKGLYVGKATEEQLVFNSSGAFVGAIMPSSIATTGTLSVTGISTFSGQLKAANGTAAAPSYSFGGGTGGAGTGLYAAGVNILGFATAGITAGNISATQSWTLGNLTTVGLFHSISIDSVVNNKGLAFNEKTATSSTIICRGDVNTGGVKISGGASGANGGFISVYGGSHASLANVVQISNGAIGSGMFLSAAGTFSVGGAASAVAMIETAGNTLTGTNQIAGYSGVFTGTSAATASIRGYSADVNTAAASFTSGFVSAFYGSVTAATTSTITRAQIFDAFGGITATGTITNQAILTDNHSYVGNFGIHLTSTNKNVLTGPTSIGGTTANDAATAGFVGEQSSTNLATASAVSLTTATAATVITRSLTAGDWDVSGIVVFKPAATTSVTIWAAALSLTTNAVPSIIGQPSGNEVLVQNAAAAFVPGANDFCVVIPPTRVSLNSTTNLFLTSKATFTVSTLAAYGSIRARRVR